MWPITATALFEVIWSPKWTSMFANG